MTAYVIDGKAIAAKVRSDVAVDVARLKAQHGLAPGLAVVLVGEDPASKVYVRNKAAQTVEVGMQSFEHKLAEDTPEQVVLDLVAKLNADPNVNGILVQMPLPKHMDSNKVLELIDPLKDVDGFHPENAAHLYMGEPRFVPATPVGIMRLLQEYDVTLEGARAVVVGRSLIVGKPMSMLLLGANASVTTTHSRTADLGAHTREADVLVVAVGQVDLVTADMVKSGSTVVDVGMNRTDDGLRGDVDPAAVEVAGLITPVPGGVGPMTIASLLRNTVDAARLRRC
jgi:methylenetetrahydrofolate dehydrogenase (NADP+) / methenyltetrahydrofolate cyclohydrolase